MGLVDAIARSMQDEGVARAEGIRQVGDIYGRMFSNLGAIGGAIPGEIQQGQMRQLEQERLRQQGLLTTMQVGQLVRHIQGQNYLGKVLQQTNDPQQIQALMAQAGYPDIGSEYATSATKMQEAFADLNAKRQKYDLEQHDQFANQFADLDPTDPAFNDKLTARLAAGRNHMPADWQQQAQGVTDLAGAQNFWRMMMQASSLYQARQKELGKVTTVPEHGAAVTQDATGTPRVLFQGTPTPLTPEQEAQRIARIPEAQRSEADKNVLAQWNAAHVRPTGPELDARAEQLMAQDKLAQKGLAPSLTDPERAQVDAYRDRKTEVARTVAGLNEPFKQASIDIAKQNQLDREQQTATENLRKSYDASLKYVETQEKLSRAENDRIDRFNISARAAQKGSSEAGALLAPEVLLIMGGGTGATPSGIRMSLGEIKNIQQARSVWDDLWAKIQRLRPGEHLTGITKQQVDQMQALVDTYQGKVRRSLDLMNQANLDLAQAKTVDEHRAVMNDFKKALNAPLLTNDDVTHEYDPQTGQFKKVGQ